MFLTGTALNVKHTFDAVDAIMYYFCMSRNTNQTIELRYGEIEAAIAQVLEIKSAGVPALRARLRHLRNMGLPDIPNPGSGRKVSYTTFQAMEMLIAVVLEYGGITSRNAVNVTPLIAHGCVKLEPLPSWEMCVALTYTQDKLNITFVEGPEDLPDVLRCLGKDSCFFVNISSCQLKLENALKVRVDHIPEQPSEHPPGYVRSLWGWDKDDD